MRQIGTRSDGAKASCDCGVKIDSAMLSDSCFSAKHVENRGFEVLQQNQQLKRSNALLASQLNQLEQLVVGERLISGAARDLLQSTERGASEAESLVLQQQRMKIGVMKNQINKHRKQLITAQTDATAAQQRCKELQQQLDKFRSELSKKTIKLEDQAKQLSERVRQFNDLSEASARKELAFVSEVSSLQMRIQSYQTQLTEQCADMAGIKAQNARFEQEISDLTRRAESAENEAKLGASQLKQHQEYTDSTRQQFITLNEQVFEQRQQCERLQHQLRMSDDNCTALNAQLAGAQAQLRQLRDQLASVRVESQNVQEQFGTRVQGLRDDALQREKHIAELERLMQFQGEIAHEQLALQHDYHVARAEQQFAQIRELQKRALTAELALEVERKAIECQKQAQGDSSAVCIQANLDLDGKIHEKLADALKQSDQLKMELKAKCAQLEAGTQLIASMNQQAQRFAHQNANLLKEKARLNQELHSAQEKLRQSSAQTCKQVELATSQHALQALKQENRIQELERELQLAQLYTEQFDHSQSACLEARIQASQAKDSADQQAEELKRSRAQLQEEEEKTQELQARIQELEKQVSALEKTAGLRETVEKLTERLKAQQAQLDQRQAQYDDVKSRFNTLTEDYNQLFDKYTQLAGAQQQKSAVIQQEFDKLLDENSQLQLQLSQLSQHGLQESARADQELQAEVASLREEIAQLQEILTEKDEKIRKMSQSNSQMIKNLSFTAQSFSKLRSGIDATQEELELADDSLKAAASPETQQLALDEANQRADLAATQIQQMEQEMKMLRAELEDLRLVKQLQNNSIRYGKPQDASQPSSLRASIASDDQHIQQLENTLDIARSALSTLLDDLDAHDGNIQRLNDQIVHMYAIVTEPPGCEESEDGAKQGGG